MSDNLIDKVNALSERLKIVGTEVGQKMSAGMSSMSFKVKELIQGSNEADKLVEEATAENLDEPDWATNLELCDMINTERVSSVDMIRGVKKRIMITSPRIQYLALVLLETIAKNCEKAFSEIAAERVLDEMVKLIDDPLTPVNNRNKALMLIESWGESSSELRYLPVFEETYKSLKSRRIRFPGRDNESLAPIFTPPRSVTASEHSVNLAQQLEQDNHYVLKRPDVQSAEQTKEAFLVARNSVELLSTVLTSSPKQDALKDELTITLIQQCRQSQHTVLQIIDTAGDNEALLFEALNVNDEIQKVLSKYEELKQPLDVRHEPEPAMIPVAVEPEESPRFAKEEEGLVRKSSGSRGGFSHGSNDEMMDDLDEMIFGKKTTTSSGTSSEGARRSTDAKKPHTSKDDLISF